MWAEGRVRSLNNGIIDTTTAHGKLIFGVFALMAEYEAALIRERTAAGLAATSCSGTDASNNPPARILVTPSTALTTLFDAPMSVMITGLPTDAPTVELRREPQQLLTLRIRQESDRHPQTLRPPPRAPQPDGPVGF